MGRFTYKKLGTRLLLPLLLILSVLIPLPYYVFQPGSAEALQPILTVQGGNKDEKGSLMLTTVYTMKVRNVYIWLYGKLFPNREVVPSGQVDRDMPPEEYAKLLQYMMSSSQENSIVAAMRYLGKPVQFQYQGVMVRSVLPDSKAKNILHVGDVIDRVDDRQMMKSEDLTAYLQTKKPGDKVQIHILRDNQPQTVELELIELPSAAGKRPGLGIEPMTKQKLENPIKVDFHTEEIGGPSAGLMFSMEIVSQLTEGDLTKGHKIAGTGTIDADGNVGQIGGIQHKIVAASQQGAEIFFAPADINQEDQNTKEAQAKAKEIGTSMKIVPVKTLTEAVNYLKQLP